MSHDDSPASRSVYSPEEYWSSRLEENFTLKGTGQLEYGEGYNRWLYRAKGRALHRVLGPLPAGASVLDVGSGVGWVVRRLLARGLIVEGCDISPDAVARLRVEIPDATFFPLRVGREAIPRPDGHYDAATMLDVAYHVTRDEEWLAGLAEIARVLRPGGALVVSDALGFESREPAPHVRFRPLVQWERAESLGLRVVDVQPYFRWLSRRPAESWMRVLPDGVRGGLEYGLERVWPRAPHMRCAVLRRDAG